MQWQLGILNNKFVPAMLLRKQIFSSGTLIAVPNMPPAFYNKKYYVMYFCYILSLGVAGGSMLPATGTYVTRLW